MDGPGNPAARSELRVRRIDDGIDIVLRGDVTARALDGERPEPT